MGQKAASFRQTCKLILKDAEEEFPMFDFRGSRIAPGVFQISVYYNGNHWASFTYQKEPHAPIYADDLRSFRKLAEKELTDVIDIMNN